MAKFKKGDPIRCKVRNESTGAIEKILGQVVGDEEGGMIKVSLIIDTKPKPVKIEDLEHRPRARMMSARP